MKNMRTSLLVGLLAMQSILLRAQDKGPPQPLALNLREAVQMALSAQGNIAIGVAGESIRVAQARLRESRAASHPDIEASITGQSQALNLDALGLQGVQLPFPGFAFPRSSGAFTTEDARVHIRQSLIDVASIRRSEAARAEIETAKTESEEARDQIAARVARLYLLVQRSAGVVEMAKALVASAESTLKEVSDRNAENKALGIDVVHARVGLAGEKQILMQAQLERRRADFELLNALNRDLDTPFDLTEPLAFTPQEPLEPAQAVAIALKSRSEILTQKKRVDVARLNDGAIQSERLPSLAGYVDAGSIGTNVVNSLGTYDVGVSLRIPVFDGGRRNSRRAEAQAYIRQEELRASQLDKQVEFEVRQALLKLDNARGQVELSGEEADAARQELDHQRRRYEQGVGTHLELTGAQVNLARAADGRVGALYAWNEARIELMQAMGTIRSLAQ